MSSATLMVILEKIASKDKDFRYMATSDLLNELQKETFKADGDLEKKLCSVVLTQLDDTSGDISGLAVKCLGLLVRKVSEARAEEMIRALCDKVVSGKKEQQRGIAAIGLKTVIADAPLGPLASSAGAIITAKMLEGAANKDNLEVVGDSLDILGDAVSRFGHLVSSEHGRMCSSLLGLLDQGRALLRKKAMHCLGALAVFLNDDLLASISNHLISKLTAGGVRGDSARIYVQACAVLCKSVGYRFGKFLDQVLPLMIKYCDEASEGDDELREYCMQALESFVVRCPHDARPRLDAVLGCCLKYIKYDPNFADDMEEDEEAQEDEEEEDGGSEDEYSDDEDISWKVRRSACKGISAIINNYPDALNHIYRQVGGELISRFREREENVRMDVFHTAIDLMHQVGNVRKRFADDDPNSPVQLLTSDIAAISRAAAKQLRAKTPKTKVGVFMLLREMVAVLPGKLEEHVGSLVPGIMQALTDKSATASSLKIEALQFLRQAMSAHPPAVFQPHVKELSKGVFFCTGERYFKVVAEALRVCEQMVFVMRPTTSSPLPASMQPLSQPLYDTVMKRLSAMDQDQEIKECAIGCMAAVVANLGDVLSKEVPGVVRVLLDRLRNEITRLSAIKAFTTISESPLNVDLGAVLDQVLTELTSFLRKANKLVRQAALQALQALAAKCGSSFPADNAPYIEEAAALVCDADLSLASLSLHLACTLLEKQPKLAPAIVDKVLPPALQLVRSQLLQGHALEQLQTLFGALARSGVHTASFPVLLDALLNAGVSKDVTTRSGQRNVAQCVAELCVAAGEVAPTIAKLLDGLKTGDMTSQRLALLTLGELGRRSDLSAASGVETAVTGALTSDSEEVKAAASLALGGITCGHLQHFLPLLLAHISNAAGQPKQQYLLLQALNEVIATLSSSPSHTGLAPESRSATLELLLGCSEGDEECRNVVAECLGHLALVHPEDVLTRLRGLLGTPSAATRAVVVSAIKFISVERPHPVDVHLQSCLLDFLRLMSDEDRHVRKAAVVSLTAVAHHKSQLVRGHLPELLPLLYAQTVIREDMIRTVDLGPFKHKIDDGLELRKAAFECLDVLLGNCLEALSTLDFVAALSSGLKDDYDVKMPCHIMLSKLAGTDPVCVLSSLDGLIDPLDKTLGARLKSDAVKQEVDRHEDMLRSCLRCVDSLSRLVGVENHAGFQSFLKRTVTTGPLKDKFAAVQKERAEAEGGEPLNVA